MGAFFFFLVVLNPVQVLQLPHRRSFLQPRQNLQAPASAQQDPHRKRNRLSLEAFSNTCSLPLVGKSKCATCSSSCCITMVQLGTNTITFIIIHKYIFYLSFELVPQRCFGNLTESSLKHTFFDVHDLLLEFRPEVSVGKLEGELIEEEV